MTSQPINATKYLRFEIFSEKPKIITIINKRKDETIGWIEWYPKWKQFCFCPHEYTIWNNECLKDIINVIEQLKP